MMDSGNSGSLQSSSGGDDEFDSRGRAEGGGVDSSPLSALLRPTPSPSAAAFSLHGSLYGLQKFTSAPPQHQHAAGQWSGPSGTFTGAAGPSSSTQRVAQADSGALQQADMSAAAQGTPPRGSRKRTRASRRAPTTVMTTDTTNFRAMVQEFTGIPSPPFAAGVGAAPAGSLRTRFDHIFPSTSSLRSAADSASASLPPYLLRPFAQKLPTAQSTFPSFTTAASSSTPSSSNIGATNASAAMGTAATAAASSNQSAAGGTSDKFELTPSALLRLQDPNSSYLSFHNLLDSQPSSQSLFGAVGGFAQTSRLHEQSPSPSEFLAGMASGSLGGLMGSERLHLDHRSDAHHHHGGDELSGVVAGGSCKLNYSSHAGAAASSSAGASADKPQDGGARRPARGEGLDPSWICTSK